MEGGKLTGGKRGWKCAGWGNGFYRGDSRTRDDLRHANEGLLKTLELFSSLLRYNYNITLLSISPPDEGAGVYRVTELDSGKENVMDGGVWGEFDDISFGGTIGGGWEGRGPAELLGVTVDYSDEAIWLGPTDIGGDCLVTPRSIPEQVTMVEELGALDTYDRDIRGLRSSYSTALRRGLHCIGMKGEVSLRVERESFLVDVDPSGRHGYEDPKSFEERRSALPPNAIAIVNLVKFCGNVDEHLEGDGELTVLGQMVGEMIRAAGLLVRDGWGGGGTNHTQKIWGEEYEGGIGGEIVRGLRLAAAAETSSLSYPQPASPFGGLVSRVLANDSSASKSTLFKSSISTQRGWDILDGTVVESLLDTKRPKMGLEYAEKQFEGRAITFEVGCAALCCASAQACLEAFYGTGDAVRMKEKCFEIHERMKSECSDEMERLKGLNHFNCDRITLGLIKVREKRRLRLLGIQFTFAAYPSTLPSPPSSQACEAAGDTETAISVLLNSRFSSTSGDQMNNWDYLNFKALAVMSVLRSAKNNNFHQARAELVTSQVCGGSEVDVLLSSFGALSVYLKTLNDLGMYDKAVATFTESNDRNREHILEGLEGWHSCVCETVTALGKAGRAQEAWDLVKSIDRSHLSTEILERLCNVYEVDECPNDVVQVVMFADREGKATDYLVRKAILAYTAMNKHQDVIVYARLLCARRKKGGRLIAGVSARERR